LLYFLDNSLDNYWRQKQKRTTMNQSQAKDTKNKEENTDGVNIQVALRCRPPQTKELKQEICMKTSSHDKEVSVKHKNGSRTESKSFNFDYVFGPNSTQKEVYEEAIKPLVDEVLAGYNCTVFAYGQTSTGKTYTMEGRRNEKNQLIPNEEGVIPRCVNHIFEYLKKNKEIEYNIRLSCLELYNEELQDLLVDESSTDKKLRLFDESKGGGTVVSGLEEAVVKTIDDLNSFLEVASQRRHTAETQLNHLSSRSHFITTLTIYLKEPTIDGEGLVKTGKLYLVDLAGSENIARSGAVKKRAQEAGMINQSLLALGRVITALTERKSHIPYRESKLTRLLQDSLGGGTKTCIIATISPSVVCFEESLSTLEYARRAMNIKNKPQQNMKTPKTHLIRDMTSEIDQLKLELTSSRLKNGVHLSLEAYEEKLELISMQERKIESLQDSNELNEKRITEINGYYEDLKFKYEIEQEEFEKTKVRNFETYSPRGNTK
jgi:kinesin family member 11